ncbi:hypothetical protein RirG_031580 [Rhizophagus irregularis DAOM 197198w]|uniref:Uncharacterized protein n=1 Tax=Rhizophagus irregularis (strain DAOM 197198w) TaxID=1432141 RepID=A0A015LA88_RHIIW|nr:hypothetical protein RirG_031580 [Rhizophagus irregularis DAOM 197198w]
MRSTASAGSIASLRPAILGMARVVGLGLSSVAASPLPMSHGHDGDEEHPGTPLWVLCVASMALVLLGGAFAGLTIA